MLKENTGVALCDSGWAYGRNWERNQKIDFDKQPYSVCKFDDYISIEHNLYHWLCENLTWDKEANEILKNLQKRIKKSGGNTWDVVEMFPEFFRKWQQRKELGEGTIRLVNDKLVCSDFLDGGLEFIDRDNTYNHDNFLSQDIQFTYFKFDTYDSYDFGYLILQIHGGCDIRGGYTDPQVFSLNTEYSIGNYDNASIWCNKGHVWDSDDGGISFSYQGDLGSSQLELKLNIQNTRGTNLEQYITKELNDIYDLEAGNLCWAGDDIGGYKKKDMFCPICLSKLSASY